MKRTRKFIATLVALIATCSIFAKESFEKLLLPYFKTQHALAGDDFNSARMAATKLAMNAKLQAESETPLEGSEAIRAVAKEVAFSTGIVPARAQFAKLSELLIALAKKEGKQSAYNIVEMRCSMAFDNQGASWLQNSTETANPYFGSSMFACGSATDWIAEGDEIELKPIAPASGDGCCAPKTATKADACCANPPKN